jgi:hypothetical protein
MKVCQDMLLDPNSLQSELDQLAQHFKELVDRDCEFLMAQLKVYKEDVNQTSAELASMQKKSEQQTKDGN